MPDRSAARHRWHDRRVPAPPASDLLRTAIAARSSFVDADHRAAFRLFNGHLEGDPRWVVDVYGTTALIFHHGQPLDDHDEHLAAIVDRLRGELPWLEAALLKEREGTSDEARRGRVVWKAPPDVELAREVREHGVRYAVDLRMNQDASFYLDTRLLRRWLLENAAGRTVLNTFAYTGSLGVAARAGGAARVLHTDLSRRFLNVAKRSYVLNGFEVDRKDFVPQDVWSFLRGRKLQGDRFDLAIVDPPFFATSAGGTIDMNRDTRRIVNKVRPLVADGGRLVIVNNALFLSGADFLAELEALCVGGWLEIERTLGVSEDVTGTPATRRPTSGVDPSPFPHSTKIAVLAVRHR
jgi:23S rRNA (cytosine1962-C5)-methyltransferase